MDWLALDAIQNRARKDAAQLAAAARVTSSRLRDVARRERRGTPNLWSPPSPRVRRTEKRMSGRASPVAGHSDKSWGPSRSSGGDSRRWKWRRLWRHTSVGQCPKMRRTRTLRNWDRSLQRNLTTWHASGLARAHRGREAGPGHMSFGQEKPPVPGGSSGASDSLGETNGLDENGNLHKSGSRFCAWKLRLELPFWMSCEMKWIIN